MLVKIKQSTLKFHIFVFFVSKHLLYVFLICYFYFNLKFVISAFNLVPFLFVLLIYRALNRELGQKSLLHYDSVVLSARLKVKFSHNTDGEQDLIISGLMRKPTFCICETKGSGQLRSNCELISTFVFAIGVVQFFYFLNPKFPLTSHLLPLYSSLVYSRSG